MRRLLTALLILCLSCFASVSISAEPAEEALLNRIPTYAYSGQEETIETVLFGGTTDSQSVAGILFEELFRSGLISRDQKAFPNAPTEAEIAASPKVAGQDVFSSFDRCFGPGASARIADMDFLGTGKFALYRQADGSYAFVAYSYGGGAGTSPYCKFIRSETQGEDLILYASYAEYYTYEGFNILTLEGFSEENPQYTSLLERGLTFDESEGLNLAERIVSGEFDEYLPLYKHTFKPNGDGTYYWASTVLKEKGMPIPMSEIDPSLAPTPSTGTTTDSSASVTDGTGSAHTAPVAPEEGSFPWGWVCLGVGVAVIALAVGILLNKKR